MSAEADMSERNEDVSRYPALGRALTWVDRPGNAKKLVYALAAACVIVLALGFTYDKHSYLKEADFAGFYAIYGFVMFTLLIFAATGLRVLVKRREDYYAPNSVDTEAYPSDQTEQVENDG